MRKQLFLALAFLAPMAAATPAMALNSSHTYSVRFDGSQVGKWKMRAKVAPATAAGGLSVCRYTVMWSNLAGAPLGRTALCRIDEAAAGDSFDCETSRKGFFETLVQKAPGTCKGFDDFGQETTIDSLVAGEDTGGHLNGVVVSASVGDVQNLLVE